MSQARFHAPALTAWLLLAACAPSSDHARDGAPQAEAQKTEAAEPSRAIKRAEVSSIRLDDFFTLQQTGQALVFDARPGWLHAMGHIPGAKNLTKNNCDTAIAAMEDEIRQAIAEGKTIVVYCSGLLCPDARTVARHIAAFGYPASVFSGGWDAWKEAGLPVE